MRVASERRGEVVILKPQGRFTGGKETKELEHKIGAVLAEHRRCVVVDLERATHLNSSAIGVLVGAHIRASNFNSEIRLCNADRGIHHTLVVLKLVNTMNVYESLVQATSAPFPRPTNAARGGAASPPAARSLRP